MALMLSPSAPRRSHLGVPVHDDGEEHVEHVPLVLQLGRAHQILPRPRVTVVAAVVRRLVD